MPNGKQLTTANASIDCAGQRALVSGGTQGIGAGIALRYALAGASVYIVGRSHERGAEVLQTLERASAEWARRNGHHVHSQPNLDGEISPKTTFSSSAAAAAAGKGAGGSDKAGNGSASPPPPEHDFFPADLTDVQQLKQVVQKVKDRTKGDGIDHLVMTQGGPPLGALKPLPSGVESAFALQCLSRFGLAYLLTNENLVRKSITAVCAPGGGSKAPLDVEDLDLLKAKESGAMWDGFVFGLLRKGQRDSSVVDAFTQVSR